MTYISTNHSEWQPISTNLIAKHQKDVYLFQPQYSATIHGKKQYWLPYSAGCLWSYVSQFSDIKHTYRLADLIFRREKFKQLVLRFNANKPKICGFSVYAWNEKYCLHIAEEIKKSYPECIIVFGGPQCNKETAAHWFVDSVVLAEGEESFLKILQDVMQGVVPDKVYDKSRLTDLEIPSPYTTGVFNDIISRHPNFVWSTVIETNRGCPYACTFCDWGSLTYSKVKKFNLGRVKEELEWIEKNPIVFVTNADANFGMFKERDLEIAKMLSHANTHGMLEAVALTYAKNSNEVVFDIAKEVKSISRGVTISVQTLTEQTLVAIKRQNMKVNDITKMMQLAVKSDVPTYTELILGLPLETAESWKNSVTDLLEYGQHNQIDVYFGILLRNSELNSLKSRELYDIKSQVVYDYVSFNELEQDEVHLPEEFEIITQTSTMTSQELIDSYMYGWVVVHFHSAGYTQQYAKYCRYVLGVSYKEFYNKIVESFVLNPQAFPYYSEMKQYVTEFVTTGTITSTDIKGVNLMSVGLPMMHQHKSLIFKIGYSCVTSFNWSNENIIWLDQLQQAMIIDPTNSQERIVKADYDIQTWKKVNTEYLIVPPGGTRQYNGSASTMRNMQFFQNEVKQVK